MESGEEPREQLGTDVRAANAEIQSRSYFGIFGRPNDVDRVVIHRVVVFFEIGFLFTRSRALNPGFYKRRIKMALSYELCRSFSFCFFDPLCYGYAANRAQIRVT
jgi:hypothetical protein